MANLQDLAINIKRKFTSERNENYRKIQINQKLNEKIKKRNSVVCTNKIVYFVFENVALVKHEIGNRDMLYVKELTK